MSQTTACYLKADFSLIRVIGEPDATLAAPSLPEGELSARALRQQAEQAASWVARQPGVRRRLGTVVVDVDEALLTWLRVASIAPPLINSAIRAQCEEWGDLLPLTSFEPLVDSAAQSPKPSPFKLRKRGDTGGQPAHEGPIGLGAISLPDGQLRLWLDSLDGLGVQVDAVMTLWHAAARAFGNGGGTTPSSPAVQPGTTLGAQGVTAVVLVEPDQRLVWCWCRGDDLMAGGTAVMPRPGSGPGPTDTDPDADPPPVPPDASADAVISRVSLDWLTWASRLACTPDRIVLVGPYADQIQRIMHDRWGSATIEHVRTDDPVSEVVRRAAARPLGAEVLRASSRRIMTRLTRRPTRAVRWQYRLAAAAIALLAVGVLLLGQRLGNASTRTQTAVYSVARQTRDEARQRVPEVTETGDILRQLEQVDLSTKPQPFRAPPPPLKIFAELTRILEILGGYEDIKLRGILLSPQNQGQCELQILTPDRRTATEIFEALRAPGKLVNWERRESVGAPEALTQLVLRGTWIE